LIIEFKSKATGLFIMTESVATMVFSAMGLTFEPKGIFTAEQVPVMRQRLQEAIDQARTHDKARLEEHDESVTEGEVLARDFPLGLSQRAYPLLDMLIASERDGVAVVWGV
jgi:hypothetical protein